MTSNKVKIRSQRSYLQVQMEKIKSEILCSTVLTATVPVKCEEKRLQQFR